MKRILGIALLCVALAIIAASLPAAADGGSDISILHTPPAVALPGLQINLTAVLVNATAASISWNNGSMAADGEIPMTNLSQADGAGWVYAAWLPAQRDGTQVSYTINASNPGTVRTESYFFTVSTPSASGLTSEQQEGWMLTMAASLTMAGSVIAVQFWYTGRRLRRGGR